MTVVTNSGPLMALAKIGALRVLTDAYGTVLLPSAVHHEVVVMGLSTGRPDAREVQAFIDADRLRVLHIQRTDLPADIRRLPLDRGEQEAIHLARRESAELILLDDALARAEARTLGLTVKGTLGVLVWAHRKGLLTMSEVSTHIRHIQARPDIWIADELCESVLQTLIP